MINKLNKFQRNCRFGTAVQEDLGRMNRDPKVIGVSEKEDLFLYPSPSRMNVKLSLDFENSISNRV